MQFAILHEHCLKVVDCLFREKPQRTDDIYTDVMTLVAKNEDVVKVPGLGYIQEFR